MLVMTANTWLKMFITHSHWQTPGTDQLKTTNTVEFTEMMVTMAPSVWLLYTHGHSGCSVVGCSRHATRHVTDIRHPVRMPNGHPVSGPCCSYPLLPVASILVFQELVYGQYLMIPHVTPRACVETPCHDCQLVVTLYVVVAHSSTCMRRI